MCLCRRPFIYQNKERILLCCADMVSNVVLRTTTHCDGVILLWGVETLRIVTFSFVNYKNSKQAHSF